MPPATRRLISSVSRRTSSRSPTFPARVPTAPWAALFAALWARPHPVCQASTIPRATDAALPVARRGSTHLIAAGLQLQSRARRHTQDPSRPGRYPDHSLGAERAEGTALGVRCPKIPARISPAP